MAATYDYTWDQGEDLTILMVYKTNIEGTETPVDLTGYTLRMDIVTPEGARRYTFNSDTINDVDPVTPGAEPDSTEEAILGTDGSISITITRALTLPGGAIYADIAATPPTLTFNYDIFLRAPDGKQKKILKGQINVEKSYTLWA